MPFSHHHLSTDKVVMSLGLNKVIDTFHGRAIGGVLRKATQSYKVIVWCVNVSSIGSYDWK